ncbi:Ras p21 protein activator [Intoshia linei]|uniref:Ras p21 protein activator n=1 Tax=Intoshia linei TaxID=1819745 RepID=A0A177BBU1_9BILA|nr:Ras p21 protein activator [Intoshia linei]
MLNQNEYAECEFLEEKWYHGPLSRHDTETLLDNSSILGSYIIRKSDNTVSSFVLSIKSAHGPKHFRITKICDDVYIGGRKFKTMETLLKYYTYDSDIIYNQKLISPLTPAIPIQPNKKYIITLISYRAMPNTDQISCNKNEIYLVEHEINPLCIWVKDEYSDKSGTICHTFTKFITISSNVLEENEWHHTNISREETGKLLVLHGKESWIVRPSDSSSSSYTLFFYDGDVVRRFKIKRDKNFYVMGGRYFKNFLDIIERYKYHSIIKDLRLRKPILRNFSKLNSPSIESLSSIQFTENEKNTMHTFSSCHQAIGNQSDILMTGYLFMKYDKLKNWRKFFFLLNKYQNKLYYYTSNKKSKPKGLIDLMYINVYPVHESLFARQYCFQLASMSLNQETIYYLSCNDMTDFDKWSECLLLFSDGHVVPTPLKFDAPKIQSKLLQSLWIKLFEIDKILKLKIVVGYVCLNDVIVARLACNEIPSSTRLYWDDEVYLENVPKHVNFIIIKLFSRDKKKETYYAQVKFKFENLTSNQEIITKKIEFSPIFKIDKDSFIKTSITLDKIFFLPLTYYCSLESLLFDRDTNFLKILCCVSFRDQRKISHSLMQIFDYKCQLTELLIKLLEIEINQEIFENVLRRQSLATICLTSYMNANCSHFIKCSLYETVNRAKQIKSSLLASSSVLTYWELGNNFSTLKDLFYLTLSNIYDNADKVPINIIFLRLICVALIDPKSFDLEQGKEKLSPKTLKILSIIASCILKVANMTLFREPLMSQVNDMIEGNMSKMSTFLETISSLSQRPYEPRGFKAKDCARHYAILHYIFEKENFNLEKMKEITSNSEFPFKLKTIFDIINTIISENNSINIIQKSVFGCDENRKIGSFLYSDINRLVVTGVDIQFISLVNEVTSEALRKAVQLAIEITTKSQESEAK